MNDPRSAAQTEENWNSYGGRPTTEEAKRGAAALHKGVWSPCSDGGLALLATVGTDDIEIVIGPDGRIKSVYWERNA